VRKSGLAALLALACLAPGCALWRRPAWELPPPPAVDAPVVQPGALHRAELDNGLDVLVLEDHRLPRVSLGVTLRRGEAMLPWDRAGLASFTSELMGRGAGDRDALALARAVDELGASLSVASGWDSTTVRVSGLSEDLGALLEILADVVLRPRFAASEARKARDEILASLERAKDDPATLARWHLSELLYDGHRYGRPQDGVRETVVRFDATAARAFHRRVFVPNVAIFFAAGDVEMQGLLERVGEAFGGWQPGEEPEPGPPPPARVPEERRIVVVDRPDLAQARIAVAHEGIARTDEDRIGASLMNVVLGGGGFSSRLMERLRAEEGLTYGVGSGFSLRRHPGPFAVSTFTRVPEVRRALDLVLEVMQSTRTSPPSEEELGGARALMVGRFALGLETSSAVMGSLVDLAVYGLPEDSLDTYRGRVRSTTADDTARLARKLLHPERAGIVLVGPAEAIVPQVEDLGPVQVVQP
jgi:predicted Zn-dependent peptidase